MKKTKTKWTWKEWTIIIIGSIFLLLMIASAIDSYTAAGTSHCGIIKQWLRTCEGLK